MVKLGKKLFSCSEYAADGTFNMCSPTCLNYPFVLPIIHWYLKAVAAMHISAFPMAKPHWLCQISDGIEQSLLPAKRAMLI